MDVSRRKFFAMMAAGAVVTAEGLWMPGQKLISIPRRVRTIADDFEIYYNGDIRYVGGFDKSYSVLDFYEFLMDWSDRPENLVRTDRPAFRATDELITLTDGYNIDANAARHLRDGMIVQENGTWASRYAIGSVEPWPNG